jgi:hypothetical protein
MLELPHELYLETLRDVRNWADDRFGPLRNFSGSRITAPEPAWWLYTCDLARAPIGMCYTPYPGGASGPAHFNSCPQ